MKKFILLSIAVMMLAFDNYAQKSYEPDNSYSRLATSDSDMTSDYEEISLSVPQKKSSNSHKDSSSDANRSYVFRSISDLAIYPLFDKYKRNQNTTLSVIDNPQKTFMTLEVKNSPEIYKEIAKMVEKDMEKADQVIKSYTDKADDFLIKVNTENGVATIFYKANIDETSCSLGLSAAKKNSDK